jgi:hypothetical protein
MNRAIALWAVPRSVSTAFERMMRERGDLAVLHEPFLAYYYHGFDRVNDNFNEGIEPDPSHDFRAIRDEILATARTKPVFFKDMAYYLRKCMSAELVGNFENAFLVRDPRKSLPSLYRLQPNATLEETGFDQQLRLMRLVHEMTGRPLIVVESDQLQSDPAHAAERFCREIGLEFRPEALTWDEDPGIEEWEPWQRWHREAMSSSGFESPSSEPEPDVVPAGILEQAVATYEEMREFLAATGRPLG